MSFSIALLIGLVIRLLLMLAVVCGLTYLVSLPYLLKGREVAPPPRAGLLGFLPALLIGIAPVVMIAGVLLIRGPSFIYPAYGCIVVGLIVGMIGPAMVPRLRARMIAGLPLLLVWAYISMMAVVAGGGMPLGLDTPIRLLMNALN